MSRDHPEQRLSQITTLWSLVRQAHQGPSIPAGSAGEEMLARYGGAIRRYLRGALRDPDAADEVFQEFSLRFVQGKLRGADPRRGRFRDYVKGVLSHLIADHHARQRKQPRTLPEDFPVAAVEAPAGEDADRAFLESWRDELLARTWAALAEAEQATGRPFYSALRARADRPGATSEELAATLAGQMGRPVTPANARQLLHRARERFSGLLVDLVAQSLDEAGPDQVEGELADLGLLDYCRAGARRAAPGPGSPAPPGRRG